MPSVPRVDRLKPIYTAAKALNFGWRFSDFLKIPAYNGISRYTNQLHRITVRFCKQSESSVGVRNFIENQLVDIGRKNPSVVIYAQPVRNSNPSIRAEYGNGRTLQINAKNLSESEVSKDFHLLFSRSGEPVVKLESRQSALVPSIQGQWTPITWLPTAMNTEELPSRQFSAHKSTSTSATEYILQSPLK
uniref:Large ribosomal subunit protein mL43 n=1 Tax=Caenorhabditis tropicalis TaxID=1561998 RepID=A0A1I7TTJ2_9PELO